MTKEMNNRQAYFNYAIEEKFIAGIVLMGTEVKSIREGKVSFNDSFCLFDKNELWVRALFIASYTHGKEMFTVKRASLRKWVGCFPSAKSFSLVHGIAREHKRV